VSNHPILIIARLTFREAIRRRIVQAGLVLGVLFLIIFSIGFHIFTGQIYPNISGPTRRIMMTEGYNVLAEAGLYAVAFMALAMGTLLSADTLAGEISSGTVHTLVSKPIRRGEIVFGKWLGIAGLVFCYLLLIGSGVIATVWAQTGYLVPNPAAGMFFIFLECLVVMSVAMLCGSRLSALATGGVVFGLYGISFIGGWVEQIGALMRNAGAANAAVVNIGIVSSLIMPSEAMWRRAGYEMQAAISGSFGVSPFATASVPSLAMIIYTLLYLIGCVALAIRWFGKRDL
jgi:ABC-type transport system involved in multi-copper enzyme maturation permease subunit